VAKRQPVPATGVPKSAKSDKPDAARKPDQPSKPGKPSEPQKPGKPSEPPKPGKPTEQPPAKKGGHRTLWITLTTVIVVLALVLGGGYWWLRQANTDTSEPQAMVSMPPGTFTIPPLPDAEPTYPLTGRAMAADASSGPALCIKIENAKEARPQLGIDSADIVFEEVVEGGITRFMAVFQSNIPKQVEPVRSLRPMDTPLAQQFSCALVFSGGQIPFVNAARKSGLTLIYMDHGDKGFSRDHTRVAPHNVVGDMATFMSAANAAKLTPPPAAFSYPAVGEAASVFANGTAAARIDIKMSGVEASSWRWSAAQGAWMRYEGTTKATVVGGKQISATNVVTLSVTLTNTQYKDPAGNPVPETKIVGSGKGTVSYAGMTMPILWSKASAKQPIVLTDTAGNPVTLMPGNTWVELVPTSGSVKTS